MSSSRRFLSLPLTVLLLAAPLCAQIGGSGTIKGTVIDPAGAVVPSATVTALNVATGVESRRETTAAGLRVIAPLPVGTYVVTRVVEEVADGGPGEAHIRRKTRNLLALHADGVLFTDKGIRGRSPLHIVAPCG